MAFLKLSSISFANPKLYEAQQFSKFLLIEAKRLKSHIQKKANETLCKPGLRQDSEENTEKNG